MGLDCCPTCVFQVVVVVDGMGKMADTRVSLVYVARRGYPTLPDLVPNTIRVQKCFRP